MATACLMSQRQLAAGPLGHFSESWVFDEGGELSMVTPNSIRAPSGAHFPLGEGSSVGQDTWGGGFLVPPQTCTNSASFRGAPDLH